MSLMFRIAEDGETAEVFVYDIIGQDYWTGEGVTAKGVVRALAFAREKECKRIVVRINSPGGDAFEGITIHNVLVKAEIPVVVDIDGLAASAASIVAMAGSRIRIAASAMVMIHEAWGMAVGPAADHEQTAILLRKLNGAMAAAYASRTGHKEGELLELMAAETWMAGKEAVDMRFADEVTAAVAKPHEESAQAWQPSALRILAACKRLPASLANSIGNHASVHSAREFRPAASKQGPNNNQPGRLRSLGSF